MLCLPKSSKQVFKSNFDTNYCKSKKNQLILLSVYEYKRVKKSSSFIHYLILISVLFIYY